MGRPALNNRPTVVRLSDDTRRRIAALVGPSGMAQFIREAVEAELARREACPTGAQSPRQESSL